MQPFLTRKGLCSRNQVVEDRGWFASTFYNDVLRPCELNELLLSLHDPPAAAGKAIALFRPAGGEVFRCGERRLMRLLHGELGRYVAAALATFDDPQPRRSRRRGRARSPQAACWRATARSRSPPGWG